VSDSALTQVLLALIVLLVAAHLGGELFARFRQPRVIGEIVGGLLAGPTVLGQLAPGVERWLFDPGNPSAATLSVIRELGLLLLMFCAGTELRTLLDRHQDRLVAVVAAMGILLPFAAGLALPAVVDLSSYQGPAGNWLSFVLVLPRQSRSPAFRSSPGSCTTWASSTARSPAWCWEWP